MANRKFMHILDVYMFMDAFGSSWKLHRIGKADSHYPAAESEAKVVDKKPLFVTDNYLFMTAFIGEIPINDNIASESNTICTYNTSWRESRDAHDTYPAAESETKVVDKEPLFVTDDYHFMTGLIRVHVTATAFQYDIILRYRCFSNSNSNKNARAHQQAVILC